MTPTALGGHSLPFLTNYQKEEVSPPPDLLRVPIEHFVSALLCVCVCVVYVYVCMCVCVCVCVYVCFRVCMCEIHMYLLPI